MNRKRLILIGALFLALVFSVGTYAYTFNTASATLTSATVGGAQIATANVSPGQPDWGSLLPHTEQGLEVLRPVAAGDETNIQEQLPDLGFHWDKVTESSPDEFSSIVYTTGSGARRDLYNLMDHAQGSGTINGVAVYFRFTATNGGTGNGRAAIKTGGNVYMGDQENQGGGVFATQFYMWETNPQTNQGWTWSDIDALQAGIQLDRTSGGAGVDVVCTQVYVVVYFTTLPITQGDAPSGNLFAITPSANFTGDLTVKIYLTNTQALNKAYKYLNMKVYLAGSLEAGQVPNYQILSPENGVVIFNITGGTAPGYTVSITGGSYAVVSGYTSQWGNGWSITPEFYCEVTAR